MTLPTSITLDIYQLEELMKTNSEIAVEKALIRMGLSKPQISQTHAFKLFGRKRVEKWVQSGLIEEVRNGRIILYDHARLSELSKISDLKTKHL